MTQSTASSTSCHNHCFSALLCIKRWIFSLNSWIRSCICSVPNYQVRSILWHLFYISLHQWAILLTPFPLALLSQKLQDNNFKMLKLSVHSQGCNKIWLHQWKAQRTVHFSSLRCSFSFSKRHSCVWASAEAVPYKPPGAAWMETSLSVLLSKTATTLCQPIGGGKLRRGTSTKV